MCYEPRANCGGLRTQQVQGILLVRTRVGTGHVMDVQGTRGPNDVQNGAEGLYK